MTIDFDNYFIEPEVNDTSRWNLYKKRVVQTGKTAGTEKNDVLAYGINIPRAVELITSDLLAGDPKIVTLKEFLAEYKKVYEKVKELAG